MFYQSSSNPFEKEALPKAYYFPSMDKQLSPSQKKICFSSNKESVHQRQALKSDAIFLRESNKLEIPTREDGTVQHELSSGSQFDESWPSTERNVSSLSRNSPSSSDTPAVKDKENHSVKIEPLEEKLRPTLSKYIDRFRHGAPTSRSDRSRESSVKDFWWLSPPSNTSTPKETSDLTTSKFTTQGSSTITGNLTSTSPPRQKFRTKRSRFPLSMREAVAATDSNTTDLLAKTDKVLEKSETTLSEVSSESVAKPPSSWMIEKQKRLDEAAVSAKTVTIKPRLAPEDDILCQWRLARRLEKAQEEAKASQGRHFTSRRPAVLTRDDYNKYLPEQDCTKSHAMDSRDRKNDLIHNENTSRRQVSKLPHRTAEDRNKADRATDDVAWKNECTEFILPEKESVKCRQRTKYTPETVLLDSNVPAVCFIDEKKLPSHVHMMCDIVPCSKQIHSENKDVNSTSSEDFSKDNTKQVQKASTDGTRLMSVNIQDGFQEKSSIDIHDIRENTRNQGLTNAPEKSDDQHFHSKGNGKQSPAPLLQTNKLNDKHRTTNEEFDVSNHNKYQERFTECAEYHTISRKTVHAAVNTDNREKTKFNELKSKENTESKYMPGPVTISAPLVSHHEHEKTGRGNHLEDIQNKTVIGTVIGQVISERLFSPMSSRHSSLSNDSEPGNVEEKTETSMASTFIESENHAKQKPKLASDEFSGDEILTRLRQQADFYRTHIRNIDKILEQWIDA